MEENAEDAVYEPVWIGAGEIGRLHHESHRWIDAEELRRRARRAEPEK